MRAIRHARCRWSTRWKVALACARGRKDTCCAGANCCTGTDRLGAVMDDGGRATGAGTPDDGLRALDFWVRRHDVGGQPESCAVRDWLTGFIRATWVQKWDLSPQHCFAHLQGLAGIIFDVGPARILFRAGAQIHTRRSISSCIRAKC